jgi:PAS domain S-box-containing protein
MKGVTAEICLPLLDEGETVGLLDLESVDGVKLTENDLRVMVAMTELVALAISRARLYARVRYSEERYRENSSDLVTVIVTTGIVRYQSAAIERMLGYTSEELLGKNPFDYVHPDDLQRVKIEAPHERLPVFYQPMVSMPNGTIVEMEALLKWAHPEQGLLGPPGFIPMAEETGLIVPMGRWVLNEACRRAKEWQERYPKDAQLTMAVNISARQLRYPELVGEVEDALRKAALDPGSLTLEITDSVLVEDEGSSAGTLQRLKELGVRLAIDDFGVGYSSLSYLRYSPVDQLKLDRVLVGNLDTDDKNLAIVRAAVDLGHALGIEVVAEGVETHEEFEKLGKLGCDVGQGDYWWGPHLPREAEELLASNHTPLPDQ